MIERPWRSSSLARENTARAPSPFSCETRSAIRRLLMGRVYRIFPASFRLARRRGHRDAQAVDEAGKHLERRRGQEQLDELGFAESGAQGGEERVVHLAG